MKDDQNKIENVETSEEIIAKLDQLFVKDDIESIKKLHSDILKEKEEKLIVEKKLKGEKKQEIEDFFDDKYDFFEDKTLFNHLVQCINSGNNKVGQKDISRFLKIDDDWIDAIETCVASISKIVKNPKIFIREEFNLTQVEKAKRIDSVSVKHLSTHTELIKEIRSDNTVVPSKVLSRSFEEESGIYENRFVYALILRLNHFVDKRYSAIKNNAKNIKQNVLSVNSAFLVGKSKVKFKLMLDFDLPPSNDLTENENEQLIARLDELKFKIDALRGSKFCHEMAKFKLIKPPIIKTNILLKNVDYKNCYNAWMLLSKYTATGFSVQTKEKDMPIDKAYFDNISKAIATTVETATFNNYLRQDIYDNLSYNTAKTKSYKFVKDVDLNLKGLNPQGEIVENPEINQYYFEQIKNKVNDIAEKSKAQDDANVHNIQTNFRKFFKGLQSINNEIFYDLMKINYETMKLSDSLKAPLKERKKDIVKLKNKIEKQKLLLNLKKDEIRLASLRLESLETKLSKREKQEEIIASKDARKKAMLLAKQKAEQDKIKAEHTRKKAEEAMRKKAEEKAKLKELARLALVARKAEEERVAKEERLAEEVKKAEEERLAKEAREAEKIEEICQESVEKEFEIVEIDKEKSNFDEIITEITTLNEVQSVEEENFNRNQAEDENLEQEKIMVEKEKQTAGAISWIAKKIRNIKKKRKIEKKKDGKN